MKKILTLLLLGVLCACQQPSGQATAQTQPTTTSSPLSEQNTDLPTIDAKVIHVVVALCDNRYQGIAPVPAKIGNGQDPFNNLYWGAAYGVKTFMKKQPQWQLTNTIDKPVDPILERLIFKHKTKNVYLIADAYDGQYIKDATQDFLDFSAGVHSKNIPLNKQALAAGGDAGLVVYIGHNLLMESFTSGKPQIPSVCATTKASNGKREAAVFACQSKRYFTDSLKQVGIRPLITTTTNMAPEAYTLAALVDGWVNNKSPEQTQEAIAQAYHKYQKSGINAARKLFALQ